MKMPQSDYDSSDLLIVDDQDQNLKLLSGILKRKGYKVRVAINGQLALQAIQARPQDLILLDIKMPNMSGYDLMEILKADPQTPEIPVIVISILSEAENIIRAFKSGCVDYITKPFRDEEVLVRVDNHLKRRRYQKELLKTREELEDRVRERTGDLVKANEELEYELSLKKAQADISKALLSQHYSIKTIFSITLDYARELTGSRHGFVSSIDRESLESVGHTLSDMFGEQCEVKDQRMAFPIGPDGKYPALSGHVLNTGKALFTNQPENHPSAKGLPDGHIMLSNYLAVLVLIENKVAGLIALANSDHEYNEKDIEVVERLSGILALALHRDQYELEKASMEKHLQQVQKLEAIGNLAGGIAHDFNNILSAIIGNTKLALGDVEKDSEIEDYLHEIYTAGIRAKDVVSKILAFARRSDEAIKPIQVNAIIKEVLKLIRSFTPATIEIKHCIESESRIMGNASQIHQILMNLCTNAIHAMENGGVLEIELKNIIVERDIRRKDMDLEVGDYVELRVSDTGTGIDPEILEKIFEPYFTTKGPAEGTGMGLSMVHGIVASYSGKMTVDSTLGKGSTFAIYLPVTEEQSLDRPYEFDTLQGGTERILFVDDEDMIAKMGRRMLESLGYSVTALTKSLEALDLFKSKPNDFDLVITDMTMPNMTGDKLALELMNIRSDIPVILCTGYSKIMSDETASKIGIKAFIYKPTEHADLAKTVRKVLDKRI
jgi:signal transduction histidine kinase/response regulator RpfG family c-di-GMP phosphodiesterase